MLNASHITKRFPGVLAVDGLDFRVDEGEIVALLGQNGAGKSTFMQILAGVHPHGSYDGEITMRGRPFRPTSVADAEVAGLALVPQEVKVAPDLTVAESMFLHAEPTRHGLIDQALRSAEARRALASFDVAVDADAAIGALDLASQQLVVIARALSKNAGLLILDEPTAALTDSEAQRLFERLRALRARGVACIFVSHRLAEVFAIADRIVVMRDGRLSGEYRASATTRDQVVRAMLGSDQPAASTPGGRPSAEKALEVQDLAVHDPAYQRRARVSGLSLAVARGEILGLYGLVGAGCAEAVIAIFGAWQGPVSGRRLINGQPVQIRSPADAVAHGIGLVAPDRRESLIHDHTLAENIALASLPSLCWHGFLDVARLRRLAIDYLQRLAIRAPGVDTEVGALSGGNQQKVEVARWLATGAKILLLVDPSRGIDIGARRELNQLWRRLSQEGYALVLVSTEADELVSVCHRVLVLRNGERAAELAGPEINEERLLRAAAGI